MKVGVSLSTTTMKMAGYWKWPFIVDFPIKNGDFPLIAAIQFQISDEKWLAASWSQKNWATTGGSGSERFGLLFFSYPLQDGAPQDS